MGDYCSAVLSLLDPEFDALQQFARAAAPMTFLLDQIDQGLHQQIRLDSGGSGLLPVGFVGLLEEPPHTERSARS